MTNATTTTKHEINARRREERRAVEKEILATVTLADAGDSTGERVYEIELCADSDAVSAGTVTLRLGRIGDEPGAADAIAYVPIAQFDAGKFFAALGRLRAFADGDGA